MLTDDGGQGQEQEHILFPCCLFLGVPFPGQAALLLEGRSVFKPLWHLTSCFSFIKPMLLLWDDNKCLGSSIFEHNSRLRCVMHLQTWGESEEILYLCVLGGTNMTTVEYVLLSWLLGLPSRGVLSEVKSFVSPVVERNWACERGLQGSAGASRPAKLAVLWPHKLG